MGLIRLPHNPAQLHDRHESYLSKGINACVSGFYLHFMIYCICWLERFVLKFDVVVP